MLQPGPVDVVVKRYKQPIALARKQEITMAIDGQARLEKAELGAMPQIFAANKAMTTTSRQR